MTHRGGLNGRHVFLKCGRTGTMPETTMDEMVLWTKRHVAKETWPPPPILQIMILKLSSPPCAISKESVQQKGIDEL
jgi:hypothetical protein